MLKVAPPLLSLKSISIWSAILLLFISPYCGFEVSFGLCILVLLLQNFSNFYFSESFLFILLALLLIVTIGIAGAFFHDYKLYDSLKDAAYSFRPVLMLLIGYAVICSNIKSISYILEKIINISVVIALLHIIYIAFVFVFAEGNKFTASRTTIFGLGNHIESLALGLTFVSNVNSILFSNLKKRRLKQIILAASIILYFSRIDIIMVIVLVFAMKGIFEINIKIIFRVIIFIAAVFLMIIIISQIHTTDESTGILQVMHKFKHSISEITSTNINTKNHEDLWKKWRAYEAKCAIDQVLDKGVFTWLFGNGFGALIDLKFTVELGDLKSRYIPSIHNGFAQLFFKTGFIGLLSFLLLNLILILPFYKNYDKSLNNYKNGVGIIFFICMLVIGGIYGGYPEIMILIGILYALNKNYEGWNNWNKGNS